MFRSRLTVALLSSALGLCLASQLQAAPIGEKVRTAMQSSIRSADEVARDQNRLPVETLSFFGIEDNMRVIELLPGGGWYTKLLVPALAENGAYYAAIGTGRVKDALADQPGFEKMHLLDVKADITRVEGTPFYTMPAIKFDTDPVDAVLTFRNYHNFDAAGRKAMNDASFAALKSGGIYAIVDHTRRHMQGDSSENRRRVDPVLVIKEVEAAGFIFEDYSDLHYRYDDELVYEVGRKSVTGNTDRFTFKFRKP